LSDLIEKRIAAAVALRDCSDNSRWARNYWSTVVKALLRKARNGYSNKYFNGYNH